MRTISAAEDAVLTAAGGRAVFWRAKIKNSGGTFRDLSSYAGQNLCLEASWKEDVDAPGMDADILLKREVEKISIAPLMAGSPVNLAFAYPGTYAPLIAIAREVQIEVAVIPDGSTPAAGDWNLAFHGYVDDVDPAQGEHLVLRCSDLQAKLRDTWIERERSYAFAQGANADRGCLYWRPTDTLAVGARVLPSDANKNGHFYRVTAITTGITGSSEPTWPTGSGATVVDGGVTWTESGATSETTGAALETIIQQILDDNLGAGAVTLKVVGSPSFTLLPWKQDRSSVWDAIRRLVDLIGWDLRYRWDSGTSSFKLTLSQPNRTASVADRTFTPSQRYPLKRMQTQIQWVRNACQVVFSDPFDRDATGQAKRKTVIRTDATSIAAYGRRFCEIAEGLTIGINTASQANALADAMIADLANPLAEHECEVPFFRFAELGDYYQFNADGIHYDSDQKLAVTGYSHRLTAGDKPTSRTALQCRGKPSAGFKRWHGKIDGDLHALDLDNSSGMTLTATAVIGGTRITATTGDTHKKALPVETEVHVSPTPGFTPSSSTLVSQGMSNNVVVPDLIPGRTYYAKAYPRGHNRSRLVRAQPSSEFSFVAGQASAGHLKSGIALGDYPLNGGFETRTDPAGMPDHWVIEPTFGTLGTNVLVMEDGNGISGGRYLRLIGNTTRNVNVDSALIPVVNEAGEANRTSQIYRLTLWSKAATANTEGFVEAMMTLYDYAGTFITASATLLIDCTVKKGHWVMQEIYLRVDATTAVRSALLTLFADQSVSSNFTIDVDEVRITRLGTDWYNVGDTTKFTDNYEPIPGFQNSWVNYGLGEQVVSFRRDQFGRVYLRGLAKSGTINATMFTLPPGFRPSTGPVRIGTASNLAFGYFSVGTNGAVLPVTGSNTWFAVRGDFSTMD
jgi:hypothetical protein